MSHAFRLISLTLQSNMKEIFNFINIRNINIKIRLVYRVVVYRKRVKIYKNHLREIRD